MIFRRNNIKQLAVLATSFLLGGCTISTDLLHYLSRSSVAVAPPVSPVKVEASQSQPPAIAKQEDPCSGRFVYDHVAQDLSPVQYEATVLKGGVDFGQDNVKKCSIVMIQVRPEPDSTLIAATNASAIAITKEGELLATSSNGDKTASFSGTTGEWFTIEAVTREDHDRVSIEIQSVPLPNYSVYRSSNSHD